MPPTPLQLCSSCTANHSSVQTNLLVHYYHAVMYYAIFQLSHRHFGTFGGNVTCGTPFLHHNLAFCECRIWLKLVLSVFLIPSSN